ncbi:PEP-CTERM sorting domain-containing protein [Persicirhabdus sediminis]|uniref:PEP-CTERM sorting domain-containing protein n=1 Tax=Persicirhabdus sediminis TaxID=454144 RepID=A0A8J7MDT5_9BACT|nr:PEP-CTERM sorting domain-containing protein [Persicirhabdus sediminis]MBK1790846.1 PEP-CTERM sorting domain-containing protein [Persicirhabdus sediminis]
MKLAKLIALPVLSLTLMSNIANAAVLASWDFTSGTPLQDTSGNGYDLSNYGNVTPGENGIEMDAGSHLFYDFSDNPTDTSLDPNSYASWTLNLTGVTTNVSGGAQAIAGSRTDSGVGWELLINKGELRFWLSSGQESWVRGHSVIDIDFTQPLDISISYDLENNTMSMTVNGENAFEPFDIGDLNPIFNNGVNSSFVIGAYGDNADSWSGSMTGASLTVTPFDSVPEPSTALLFGGALCSLVLTRRRS